jgi:predicted O-methyltransferase YrrM
MNMDIFDALLNDLNQARTIYSYTSRKVLRKTDINHYEPSLIYSKEDVKPSIFLINMIVDAIKIAANMELNCGKKGLPDSQFLNIFPGEHYRLLNAIVRVSGSKNVVEIGTATGMGTLALQDGIDGINVVTYDIIDWDKLAVPSHFDKTDFDGGRISQIIGDLSDDLVFEQNVNILNSADLIFMDAPKDDVFEYKMAEKLSMLSKKSFKLLIVDDIHFVNMIDFWRSISSPKLDVSSFGHWSGTGLVDIREGLKFQH